MDNHNTEQSTQCFNLNKYRFREGCFEEEEGTSYSNNQVVKRIPAPVFWTLTGLYEGQPDGNHYLLGGFGERRKVQKKSDSKYQRVFVFPGIEVSAGIEDNFHSILAPDAIVSEQAHIDQACKASLKYENSLQHGGGGSTINMPRQTAVENTMPEFRNPHSLPEISKSDRGYGSGSGSSEAKPESGSECNSYLDSDADHLSEVSNYPSEGSTDTAVATSITAAMTWRSGNGGWRNRYPSSDLGTSGQNQQGYPASFNSIRSKNERIRGKTQKAKGAVAPGEFRPAFRVLQKPGSPNYQASSNVANHPPSNTQSESEDDNGPRGANISDDENCALWVMKLPRHVTYTTLLGAIRGVGKVVATVIKPADGDHSTAAAKIVFFEHCQAKKLLKRAALGQFQVQGSEPVVIWKYSLPVNMGEGSS